MRKIPRKLQEDMASDPYYSKCCITGLSKNAVKIDWHHNLIYAGRQVNEKWCILPLADFVHQHIVDYKRKCDWIMLNRATNEELEKYSKAIDFKKERDRLNKIYGQYKNKTN